MLSKRRKVILVPYTHLPSFLDDEDAIDFYKEVLRQAGYMDYLNRVFNSIVRRKMEKVYVEGLFAGEVVTDKDLSELRSDPFFEYQLHYKILDKVARVQGMEDRNLYRAHGSILSKKTKYSEMLDKHPDNSLINCMKLVYYPALILLTFFDKLTTIARDISWASSIKNDLGSGEEAIVIYGADHMPERFLLDIEYEFLYPKIHQDAEFIYLMINKLELELSRTE